MPRWRLCDEKQRRKPASEVSTRKADLLDREMREKRVKQGVQPRMRLSEDALGINNREDPGHAGGLQAPAVLGAVGQCC